MEAHAGAGATAIIRASPGSIAQEGGVVADAAAEPVLMIEDVGPVRRLTMNRPAALNALNADLTTALSEAIRAAGADDGVSVVILRGAGRAFCAGYDLNEDASGGSLDARHWHADLAQANDRMLEILD